MRIQMRRWSALVVSAGLLAACTTDAAETTSPAASTDAGLAVIGKDDATAAPDASAGSGNDDASAEVLTPEVGQPEASASSDGAGSAETMGSLADAAAALDRARWELHCGNTVEDGRVCEYSTQCVAGSRTNFDKTVLFGGTPGKIYNVTLRWRGVVEPRKYLGGQSDNAHFRIGGLPDPDPSTNLYGVYSVEVSAPKQIYYLNDDTKTGHYVFTIDHTKTIEIEGGASVRLVGSDQVPPCYAARNCMPDKPVCTPFVIDGIPPAPAAFDGQFIQMDVVSVVLKP